MKNTLRIFLMSIFSALFALCLIFSINSFAGHSANAEIFPDTYELVEEASICVEPKLGLRFEAVISLEQKNTLEDVYGEGSVEFGMLITVDGKQGTELNLGTKKATEIVADNWIEPTSSAFGKDYTGFYGSLVGGSSEWGFFDFEQDYYSEVFIARGYLTCTDKNGVAKTVYTNTVERSMAGVAQMLQDSENYNELNDVYKTAVNSILDSQNVKDNMIKLTYKCGLEEINIEHVKGVVLDDEKGFTPIKEGYDFGGWFYDDKTFKNAAFNGEIAKGDVLVYAKWIERPITNSASVISSIQSHLDPYTKVDNFTGPTYRDDVYEFRNSARSNYNHRKILKIDKEKFGGLFVVGNYILIDLYCNANLNVVTIDGIPVDPAIPKLTSGGDNDGGIYNGVYKQYKLVEGKYVYQSLDLNTGNSWSVMALKITDANKDTLINFYAGPAKGEGGVYFGNVTVCSSAEFERLLAK